MEQVLTLQQVCKSFVQGDICTQALNQVDLKVTLLLCRAPRALAKVPC